MNLIAFLIRLGADLYLLVLGLCLVVEPRMFHFSPLLGRLRELVEPLLGPLRRGLGTERRAIFAAAGLVVVAKGLLLGWVEPAELLFSPASYRGLQGYFGVAPVLTSLFLSLVYVVDFLLVFFFIALVVSALVEPYTMNPITRTLLRLVGLGEEALWGMLRHVQRGWPRRLLLGAAAVAADGLVAAGLVLLLGGWVGAVAPIQSLVGLGFYSALSLCLYGAGFFSLILIVGALMSWFSPDPRNPLVQFVASVNAPILLPFQRFIPLLGGMDISPIFAILLIEATRQMAARLLAGLFGGWIL